MQIRLGEMLLFAGEKKLNHDILPAHFHDGVAAPRPSLGLRKSDVERAATAQGLDRSSRA